jgi:hypothetical protein
MMEDGGTAPIIQSLVPMLPVIFCKLLIFRAHLLFIIIIIIIINIFCMNEDFQRKNEKFDIRKSYFE